MSVCIGVDFGGVIANLHPVKQKLAAEHFGISVPYGPELTREKLMPLMGADDYHRLLQMTNDYLMELPLVDGAQQGISKLHHTGYKVICVSMQTVLSAREVEAYTRHHGILLSDMIVVRTDKEKREACARIQPWAFVDDHQSVLNLLEGLNINRIWMDVLRTNEPSRYPRAQSWNDVLGIFRKVENRDRVS